MPREMTEFEKAAHEDGYSLVEARRTTTLCDMWLNSAEESIRNVRKTLWSIPHRCDKHNTDEFLEKAEESALSAIKEFRKAIEIPS